MIQLNFPQGTTFDVSDVIRSTYLAKKIMIAKTPKPPYYAVIFTTTRTEVDEGYAQTARRMVELASQQPGFLGVDSARQEVGITVSYWQDLDAIKQWKENAEHTEAREKGRSRWYSEYSLRIAKVEHAYDFSMDD